MCSLNEQSDALLVDVWMLEVERLIGCYGEIGLYSILTSREQERADRFRSVASRRQSIAARGAMRLILGAVTGRASTELEIGVSTFGKPYLSDGAVCFNLSHSNGWIALAVSSGAELGLDIQYKSPSINADIVADFLFSEREAAAWKMLPDAEKLPALYRLWTCKEALSKGVGEGLGYGFSGLDLQVDLAGKISCFTPWDEDINKCWALNSISVPLASDLEAALAVVSDGRHCPLVTIHQQLPLRVPAEVFNSKR